MTSASPIAAPPRLGLEHNGICMSVNEFDAIDDNDDDYTYELIHGVLVVNPIPSAQERGPNQELAHQLLNYKESHPRGRALDDTIGEEYVRTAQGRRRADRVIWTGLGRQPILKTDTPSIVVEFVSAGRKSWQRDYVEKRDEYLPLGVIEYWVINRFDRTMTVFRQPQPRTIVEQIVKEGEIYRCDLLPGFELAIATLFAVADRWNPNL